METFRQKPEFIFRPLLKEILRISLGKKTHSMQEKMEDKGNYKLLDTFKQ